MIKTKTYQRGGSEVTISIDFHCGTAPDRPDWISNITSTVDQLPAQTKNGVKDSELDKTLRQIEADINRIIDNVPVINQQLEDLGYE